MGADGCLVTGYTNVAKLLSHQTFEGDVVFITEFTNRPMFGTGYQSGLWSFLVPADATLDSIPNNGGAFRDYALGTVGDKIYAPSDYTYVYSSSINAAGSSIDQYLGQSWKNINGFHKLQRINGRIGSYISPNGNTWTQVGNEIELPAELANIPVKLGYRSKKIGLPDTNSRSYRRSNMAMQSIYLYRELHPWFTEQQRELKTMSAITKGPPTQSIISLFEKGYDYAENCNHSFA